jgi:hypothetical protein
MQVDNVNEVIFNINSVLYYKTIKFKRNITFISIKLYIVTRYCTFWEHNMIVLRRIIECCPYSETDVHQILTSLVHIY